MPAETLSPVALARQVALSNLACELLSAGAAFLEDLSDPENQREAAYSATEWSQLCKAIARVSLRIERLTADTITAGENLP